MAGSIFFSRTTDSFSLVVFLRKKTYKHPEIYINKGKSEITDETYSHIHIQQLLHCAWLHTYGGSRQIFRRAIKLPSLPEETVNGKITH